MVPGPWALFLGPWHAGLWWSEPPRACPQCPHGPQLWAARRGRAPSVYRRFGQGQGGVYRFFYSKGGVYTPEWSYTPPVNAFDLCRFFQHFFGVCAPKWSYTPTRKKHACWCMVRKCKSSHKTRILGTTPIYTTRYVGLSIGFSFSFGRKGGLVYEWGGGCCAGVAHPCRVMEPYLCPSGPSWLSACVKLSRAPRIVDYTISSLTLASWKLRTHAPPQWRTLPSVARTSANAAR